MVDAGGRAGRRAGKRICRTAIANSSYKEALQKSRTGATREPVARAVSSVRVGECKRAHEGTSTCRLTCRAGSKSR